MTAIRQWWVVGMMTLLLIFSFLDRGILALLVEPIKADLGLTDTQMSLLLGLAFAAFYAIMGVPFGMIADRGNRVRLVAVGLFLWTLATALSGRARSFGMLFLLRMGVGVGEATLGPAAPSIISDTVRKERLATAMSVYMTGAYIGAGLASLIGGVLVGVAQRIGDVTLPVLGLVKPWQMVYLVIGVAGFVPLLLLLVTVQEPERKGQGAKAPPPSFEDVKAQYRRHRSTIFFHHLGFASLAFSSYGVGSWLPAFFVRAHGWSIEKIGLWFGLNGMVTAVIGVLLGGWIADRWVARGRSDAKIRVALLGSLVWFPFGILYPLASNDVVAMLGIVGATLCSAVGVGCAIATLQELVPNRMRGLVTAAYAVIANFLGLAFGPLAVALLTDHWFQDAAQVGRSILVVSVVAHVISSFALWRALSPYRRSLELESGTPKEGDPNEAGAV